MEPALTIITRLGGITAVADIAHVHRTRVWNWTRDKRHGGTGGLIPQRHHPTLLAYARESGIPLTSDEFLPPANDGKPDCSDSAA